MTTDDSKAVCRLSVKSGATLRTSRLLYDHANVKPLLLKRPKQGGEVFLIQHLGTLDQDAPYSQIEDASALLTQLASAINFNLTNPESEMLKVHRDPCCKDYTAET